MKTLSALSQRVLFFLIATLMLTFLSGCAQRQPSSEKPIEVRLFEDVSGSISDRQARSEAGVTNAILDDAVLPGTSVTVFSFGGVGSPELVWSGIPNGAEDLSSQEAATFSHRVAQRGTLLVPILASCLAYAQANPGKDFAIVIDSDGGFSDFAEAKPLAAKLATLPNVKFLAALPVSNEANDAANVATSISDVLAPFGNREAIAGENDADQAISRLRDALR